MRNQNLTESIDILYAMEKKYGKRGVITWFAQKHGYSRPYMSQTINGSRSNPKVLQLFANYLGCPVYGIKPDNLQEICNA